MNNAEQHKGKNPLDHTLRNIAKIKDILNKNYPLLWAYNQNPLVL